MKTFWLVSFLGLLRISLSFGADVPYDFQTLDIACPGSPDCATFPDDVNDSGAILSNIQVAGLAEALVTTNPVNPRGNKFRQSDTTVSCTGIVGAVTQAFSINAHKEAAGYCANAPSAPSKLFGFVHNQGGLILLDFPGADGTMAFGNSDTGKVTGQFFGPLRTDHGGAMSYRFHCFTWDSVTNHYTQIDYPAPNTYVSCSAINKKGQILVEHITVTLQNEYLQHGFSIYDNGIWTLLGLTFEHIGGPWVYFADLDNDGASIGLRSQNDGNPARIVLADDGKEFSITGIPVGWEIVDVRGQNNKGQFVGMYKIQAGIDPVFEYPIYKAHGFIATPAPMAVAKGRVR